MEILILIIIKLKKYLLKMVELHIKMLVHDGKEVNIVGDGSGEKQ